MARRSLPDSVEGHGTRSVYDTGSEDGTVEHLRPVTVRASGATYAWARASFELVPLESRSGLHDDDELIGGEHLQNSRVHQPAVTVSKALLTSTRNEHGRRSSSPGVSGWCGKADCAGTATCTGARRDDGSPSDRPVPPETARVFHLRPRAVMFRSQPALERELEQARQGVPVENHTLVYLAGAHDARAPY
jgi:hypothetical protein